MKLRNTTDLPESIIREVIDFVRPSKVRHVDVYVENRNHAGSAIAHTRGYITVGVGSEKRYPVHMNWNIPKGGYCFDDWVRSREEMLVVLMSHEFRHQWQYGVGQSMTESMHRSRRQGYVGYTASKVVHDADGATVQRGRTTFYHARVVKVRGVRRVGVTRRRGQKGGRERDADIYAQRMLRAWRRVHPAEPYWGAAGVEA